jgi:predicted KAP-like P-loop ATPase
MAKKITSPIRSEVEYDQALAEIEQYFDKEPKRGTRKADRFEYLADAIREYEDQHWAIEQSPLSADRPISSPQEDIYGLDPFSSTIARSIETMSAPDGVVLAINGRWGSGKSSAINLILHHLRPAIEGDNLRVLQFNPWWFSGPEALTLAFFRELGATIGPSISDQAKSALIALGERLVPAAPLIGALTNFATGGLAGGLASGAASLVGNLIKSDKTIEEQYSTISGALSEQSVRFLVIVDDLDRLNPDDALLMFRLIKSVGRLPNVIYLLAFDRELAEKTVHSRFPSEGPHYLEKILQAPFQLPAPQSFDLRNRTLTFIEHICGAPPEDQIVRFMNIFYDVIAPHIKTPRDVVRLANALRVTWPAVAGDVNRADFIALEALRLFATSIYDAIRDNPERLCGKPDSGDQRPHAAKGKDYDDLLLSKVKESLRQQYRVALMRLFPRLDSVWSNTWHTDEEGWQRERLVCSRRHFDTYFAFSVGTDVLQASELAQVIGSVGDEQYVRELLKQSLRIRRKNGSTKVPLILEELTYHASEVAERDILPLLKALFQSADEMDVEFDRGGAFQIASNELRIHWLINRLILDRFGIEVRSQLFESAVEYAALGWLVDFARRCEGDLKPDKRSPDREPIVTETTAKKIMNLALERLRRAASGGSLAIHPKLIFLLHKWIDFSGENSNEVREWIKSAFRDDSFIIIIVRHLISSGWSHVIGDRVARRSRSVQLEAIKELMDPRELISRVDELLASTATNPTDRETLEEFKGLSARSNRRESMLS